MKFFQVRAIPEAWDRTDLVVVKVDLLKPAK
jgi:hypothetical protein